MSVTFAIIECPKCGKDECKISALGKRGVNVTDPRSLVWQVHYDDLKKRFDAQSPVKCAKCGNILTLHRPKKIVRGF